MTTLAQVVCRGLSEEVFEWRFDGYKRAGCRKIWGQGVPGRDNSKCKGPEAEKRLTCKRKRKEKGGPGAERKQGVLEMNSKREVRKALKTKEGFSAASDMT